MPYDAVILAGGRARRLGGLDKPGAPVGGRSLIERVAGAVTAARTLVVVGPPRPGRGLERAVHTREDPPGSGPVPALRAGLALVTAERFALLAADLPFLDEGHVAALLAAAREPGAPGAVLVDDEGNEQWLTGVWRTEPLREALAGYDGRSLRGLLGPLGPVAVRLGARADGCAPWFDCDTMDDLDRARRSRVTSEETA
ncbi:molybdenum cofactor guanylyltransferase [Microtetraspora niveoalba]|uniref:molybdenum cofactor guanylyltransferase n=1 Tax=Microtetraspora niveoalba TaxID=46175 RepID=UPI00082C72CA|nr:molybdenum cofactor guanylyltransferase [Microtetraspora niveoalba]